MLPIVLLGAVCASVLAQASPQAAFLDDSTASYASPYHTFPKPIRRVAVIGAGPSGLQSAAHLREHGFDVRLFERTAHPGGNWYYNPVKPLNVSFPDLPVHHGAYTPDIPETLPRVRVFKDGEGGVTNEERLREHWNPSPVWEHLKSNSAPVFTSLRDIQYAPDATWELSHIDIGRHVRQYASYKGLNSNDDEARLIASYSTRVERVQKSTSTSANSTWTLTLRKMEPLPHSGGKVRAEYWEEGFDAVVVATGPFDGPHVPPIPGLADWANALPETIWHSRQYRRPEELKGKNVLIIGASISASEIARDIKTEVNSFCISLRDHERVGWPAKKSFRRLPPNITHVPEVRSFSKPDAEALSKGLAAAKLTFINGTTISGFDVIILATGYKRSNPFLVDYHNATILGNSEPEYEVAPIITDGSHLRSLHWTGNYIPDPTLAFMNVRTWTIGHYQALAFARVWSGKARLPSVEKMWAQYPGPRRGFFGGPFGSLGSEASERQYVSWLNSEAVELGGRLVEPWSVRGRELFVYYSEQEWEPGYTRSANFSEFENVPRSEWPVTGNAGGLPVLWGENEREFVESW